MTLASIYITCRKKKSDRDRPAISDDCC